MDSEGPLGEPCSFPSRYVHIHSKQADLASNTSVTVSVRVKMVEVDDLGCGQQAPKKAWIAGQWDGRGRANHCGNEGRNVGIMVVEEQGMGTGSSACLTVPVNCAGA